MPEDEIRGSGFTIKDKRAFDSKGELKEESVKAEKKQAKEEMKEANKEGGHAAPFPEVNFSSFLLSLSSSALLHLGEIADPQSGEKRKDLMLAKHTIDIISMLKEKTKSNLTQEEGNLLEHLLYDLRMRFVKASE